MRSEESQDGLTFEQAFTRLEEVVRQLEGGQQSLDRAIELYEEGMRLSRHCDAMLQHAQLRVTKLQSDMNSSSQGVRGAPGGPPAYGANGASEANAADVADADDDDQRNLPW